MDQFWFNRCFRERSLRDYKKSSALHCTLIHVFLRLVFFFEIAQVFLRSKVCRVYMDHLQNE